MIGTQTSIARFHAYSLFLFLSVLGGNRVVAQAIPLYADSHFTYDTIIPYAQFPEQLGIPLPGPGLLNSPEYFVRSAKIFISFRTGATYIWGSSNDLAFQLTTNLTLNYADINEAFSLSIYNEQPEVLFLKEFTSELIAHISSQQDQEIELYLMSPFIGLSNEATTTNMTDQLQQLLNELEIVIHYDIEYGISTDCEVDIIPLENTPLQGKYYTFSWDNNTCNYPDYHFQLLRLYNNNPLKTDESIGITAKVDWAKAMDYQTGGSNTSITLAIAEGTGFYVWRVRPIGSFFTGGISDSRNYGEWSKWNNASPDNNTEVNLEVQDLGVPFFFYNDSDENKNWIYSRTFTEQGKTHEAITFANGLLQSKQEQSYFPSQGVILTSQHVQDFSGRPALNTMPVPISEENGLTYQEKFIHPKTNPSELYNSRHFDADSTYRSPSPLDDTQSAMIYYSSNNPDQSIPDAQGYAYQRSLFHSDGTARIKEQSGVGPTHMISDDPERGKTVKTQYAVPSEDELVRLFGSEAPHHESVRKIIKIDENGTAAIQYITHTGNLIATALSFSENGNMSHIWSLDGELDTIFQVNDPVTRNIKAGNNLLSSRRLTLVRPSPVEVSYRINCKSLKEGCLEATLDCGYHLRITLHNLTQETSTEVLAVALDNDCQEENQQIIYDQISLGILQPGEYIIEKRLESVKTPSSVLRLNADSIRLQISPLTKVIIDELEEITDFSQMDKFHSFLYVLAEDVHPGTSDNLISKYQLDDYDPSGEQYIEIFGDTPHTVIVGSTCCSIEIPIYFTPLPICDNLEFDGEGRLIPESYPDYGKRGGFSQYAIDYLTASNCITRDHATKLLFDGIEETDEASKLFNTGPALLSGWPQQAFDEMIFNMLTDEYACSEGQDTIVHYTCDEVMACWTGVLSMIRDQICQQKKYTDGLDLTTSGAVDNETGDTDTNNSTHNNHINSNSDGQIGWPMSMFFPDDPGEEIREDQPVLRIALASHLVKDFLDCTGYQFEAIFPLGYPIANYPEDYNPNYSWQPQTRNTYLNNPFFGIHDKFRAYKYYEYNFSHPEIEVMSCFRHPDSCYITITNENTITNKVTSCCVNEFNEPIPCEYCDVGRIQCEQTYEDWNCGQRYAFFEKIRNTIPYSQRTAYQPNAEPGIDWNGLCEHIEESISSIDWDLKPCQSPTTYAEDDMISMDTCSFFYSNYYYPRENENDELRYTSIAGELILAKEETCRNACLEKRQTIRDSLLLELRRKCYLVGGCTNANNENSIPLSHIDQIVDQLVGECTEQCKIESCNCRQIVSCRPIGLHRTKVGYEYMRRYPILELGVAGSPVDSLYASMFEKGFFVNNERRRFTVFEEKIHDFSFQEAISLDQATNWFMQIELPSKCDENFGAHDCDPVPEPLDFYEVDAKARLNLQVTDELDLFRSEDEIMPTLRSPPKTIHVEIDNSENN